MNKIFRLLFLSIMAVTPFGMSRAGLAASYTAVAISDSFVTTGPSGNLSNNNYGGGGALAVAASGLPNGEFQSVIKFGLAAARSSFDVEFGAGEWSIQSVSLQLSSSPHSNAIYNDVAPGLFSVSLMQNNSWVEGTGNASNPAANGISYNSLQSTFVNNAVDQPLGTFSFSGGTSGANNYALNLSSDLAADILAGSDMSLRLFAADGEVSYLFSSRAAGAGSQPQLTILAVPEPNVLALLGLGLGILLWRFHSGPKPSSLR